MPISSFDLGLRVVGGVHKERVLVDAELAYHAQLSCDSKADLAGESYLSVFCFCREMKNHIRETCSTRGYRGMAWSPVLWFDIDESDLEIALQQARVLSSVVLERYDIDDDQLAIFFSGSKGFHIGIKTSLWSPEPSRDYCRHSRRLAANLASIAGVRIDPSVYDTVRLFRAPNSRHPKTGLHKVPLSLYELLTLDVFSIKKKAKRPRPFSGTIDPVVCRQAVKDWNTAVSEDNNRVETFKAVENRSSGVLHARTRSLLYGELPAVGQRANTIFKASANLREIGCSDNAILELLLLPGMDSGLSRSEVQQNVRGGISHVDFKSRGAAHAGN